MKKYLLLFSLLFAKSIYCQELSVFNIDTTQFPEISAEFYLWDQDLIQITDTEAEDFVITEDGQAREVISVSCPDKPPLEPLSIVIMIDRSASMQEESRFDLAKAMANRWIDAMPDDDAEIAICSFDEYNYYEQNFTNDKAKLYDAVDNLKLGGSSSFDAAFLDEPAGALLIAESAEYKPIVILITDGSDYGNQSQIITKANSMGVTVFCVTLGVKCHPILQNITLNTGGMYYEKIESDESITKVYQKMKDRIRNEKACSIRWLSEKKCNNNKVNLSIYLPEFSTGDTTLYIYPISAYMDLLINPAAILFNNKPLGLKADTTITITAYNADFDIRSISSENPEFEISPASFLLPAGQSRELTLSFTPNSKEFILNEFSFENDLCERSYYSCSKYNGAVKKDSVLELTHPNGGEVFLVGSDTTITWKGMLPTESATLEYSWNNGKSWKKITDNATDLKYLWEDIPLPVSDSCLVKVIDSNWNAGLTHKPEIEWSSIYGGSLKDANNYIYETHDGGFILVGETKSNDGDIEGENHGANDILVIRLDKDGKIVWKRLLGGSYEEYFSTSYNWNPELQMTDDYCYVLACGSTSNDGDITGAKGYGDVWIVKLDDNGEIVWEKSYGGSRTEYITTSCKTREGGFVFTGKTWSNDGDVTGYHGEADIWIINLDSLGNLNWEKTIGGSLEDEVYSIKETIDGGFIACGMSRSIDGDIKVNYGFTDGIVFKLDSQGNKEWFKNVGGKGAYFLFSVHQTIDGTYYASGYKVESSSTQQSDYIVAKLNDKGMIEWKKSFGGTANDFGYTSYLTDDGACIVGGESYSVDGDISSPKGNNGRPDIWIIKVNKKGKLEWEKSLGGINEEFFKSIVSTNDGGFIVAGSTNSWDTDVSTNYGREDFWLIKLNSIGQMEWEMSLGNHFCDLLNNLQLTMDGGIIVSGQKSQINDPLYESSTDFLVYKLKASSVIEDISDNCFSIVAPECLARDIDMGIEVVDQTKFKGFTQFLVNPGEFPVRVDNIIISGGDESQFAVVPGYTPVTIGPSESEPIEFSFTPASVGPKSSTIIIQHQSGNSSYTITGQGIQPDITVVNKLIDFGIVAIGTYRDSLNAVTITNCGDQTINISNIKHGPPNDVDFSTISGNDVLKLEPGDTIKMDLRYTPSSNDPTSGIIEFHHDGPDSPARVNLLGQGIYFNPQISADYSSAPVLVCENSFTDSIRIENIGQNELLISDIKFIGADAVNFEILESIAEIPKGEADFVVFKFQVNAPGDYEAELQISSNATNNAELSIPVSVRKELVEIVPDALNKNLGAHLTMTDYDFDFAIINNSTIETEAHLSSSPNISIDNPIVNLTAGSTYTAGATLAVDANEGVYSGWIDLTDNICIKTNRIVINYRAANYFEPRCTIQAADGEAFAGEKVEIPVYLRNAQDMVESGIYAIEANMSYNNTLLAPIGISPIRSTSSSATISLGQIPISGNSDTTLFTVEFNVGLGNQPTTELILLECHTLGAEADMSIVPGLFTLKGICDEGGQRLINPNNKIEFKQILPNPAGDYVTLEFELSETGPTEVSIINALGQLIRKIAINPETGSNSLLLDTDGLCPGQYFVQLRTPTFIRVKSLIIQK